MEKGLGFEVVSLGICGMETRICQDLQGLSLLRLAVGVSLKCLADAALKSILAGLSNTASLPVFPVETKGALCIIGLSYKTEADVLGLNNKKTYTPLSV